MQLLFFAARRLIECVGLAQPTVFVFEDLHWAQSSEIALLEYLAKHVRDRAVMLVATARPELLDAHSTWGSGLAAQTTIALEPLGADDAETLAAQIVESSAGAPIDLARLVDVAGGNPLFLEELAASVVELGDSADLPVTVREAIAARIDALPSDARDALLSAAVSGRRSGEACWRKSSRRATAATRWRCSKRVTSSGATPRASSPGIPSSRSSTC